MLVERGVFKKVKIAFLPVGHTHNIVDQMFSCFARALNNFMFSTILELHEVCRQSYQQSVCGCGNRWKIMRDEVKEVKVECGCVRQYVHMEEVKDMACWGPVLRQYLAKNITGISKPRYFKVRRDLHGVVRHHYRSQLQNTRTDDDLKDNENVGCSPEGALLANFDKDKQARCLAWMPLNRPGFVVFPKGFPPIDSIVNVPKKALDWEGLKKTQSLIIGRTSPESVLWWANTLEYLEEAESRYNRNNFLVY